MSQSIKSTNEKNELINQSMNPVFRIHFILNESGFADPLPGKMDSDPTYNRKNRKSGSGSGQMKCIRVDQDSQHLNPGIYIDYNSVIFKYLYTYQNMNLVKIIILYLKVLFASCPTLATLTTVAALPLCLQATVSRIAVILRHCSHSSV